MRKRRILRWSGHLLGMIGAALWAANSACDSGGGSTTTDSADDDDDDDDDDDNTEETSTPSSSSQDSSNDTGTSQDITYTPCPPDTRVGGFQVDLAPEFTGITGGVYDAVLPSTQPKVLKEVGSCKLLQERINICDPKCEGTELCNNELKCVPFPVKHTLGTATIDGMKIAVSMEPKAPGNNYTNPGTLPHPGYDDGAHMHLKTAGGDYSPIDLMAVGVPKLEAPSTALAVERDKALAVTWTKVAADPGIKVRVELVVNRHGSTPSYVACETDDSGSLEIPAELVNSVLDAGVTGFPWVVVSRRSVTSMAIEPGCVEFSSVAQVQIDVTVPGVMSCKEDGDCPEGQTCQEDLTCK